MKTAKEKSSGKIKKKVLSHIKDDTKEYKKQMKDDRGLVSYLKKKKGKK